MIRIYPLNGLLMQTREQMHDHLMERFHLDAHYGRNFDALYDMLTEREDGGAILLEFAEHMDRALLSPLVALCMDLCRQNKNWTFSLTAGRQDCHSGCSHGEEA